MREAGIYVQLSNVQNALFVVCVILSLSVLDMLYRFARWIGILVPLTREGNLNIVISRCIDDIVGAWRHYYPLFSYEQFQSHLIFIMKRDKMFQNQSISSWDIGFLFCRSAMLIIIAIYILSPSAALRVDFWWVVTVELIVFISAWACTLMGSPDQEEDQAMCFMDAAAIALAEAKEVEVVSDEEFRKAIFNDYQLQDLLKTTRRRRHRFAYLQLHFGYRFLGTIRLQLLPGRRRRLVPLTGDPLLPESMMVLRDIKSS